MHNAGLGAVPYIPSIKVQNLHTGMPKLPLIPMGAALSGDLHRVHSHAIAKLLPRGGDYVSAAAAYAGRLTIGKTLGRFRSEAVCD
jgi:hypothetical protein